MPGEATKQGHQDRTESVGSRKRSEQEAHHTRSIQRTAERRAGCRQAYGPNRTRESSDRFGATGRPASGRPGQGGQQQGSSKVVSIKAASRAIREASRDRRVAIPNPSSTVVRALDSTAVPSSAKTRAPRAPVRIPVASSATATRATRRMSVVRSKDRSTNDRSLQVFIS